jgi:hypothetical protein
MTDNSDWYIEAGKARLQEITAQRAQALADLEVAKQSDPYATSETATEALQRIANLDAERSNMMQLYQAYWNSQHPPTLPEPSRQELLAKPMDQMTHADMYKVLKGSTKHGIDDAGYMAGIREVAARRARGE